jgi:Ca-activated chloride channel family protein
LINLTFDNPIYLWYLISLPLLIYTHFYLLRHTKQKALKFANFEALQRVTGEKLLTKNITVLLIRMLLLICIIFAVSGTTIWYEGKVSQNDFVIGIDVSASMAASDIKPTRLDAAKEASIGIVDGLKAKSNIAVLSFSGTTFIDTGLIDNRDTVKKTIDAIEVSKTGGTDIAGAIITGTNMLLASEKGKSMVLITDGSNTVSSFITDSVKNGLDYEKKNHVVIHTIGIGSDSGPIGYLPEYYNISAVYSENTLLLISNETSGKYFKIENQSDLERAKEEISKASDTALIPIRLNYGLMLISLGILFIEWGLINSRFRKIP